MASRVVRSPKLVIFNLPWSIGPKELRTYFAKFGAITYSDVKFDKATGFSKGFGFIEFGNPEDTHKVLEVPVHKLEGNILNIRRSENE